MGRSSRGARPSLCVDLSIHRVQAHLSLQPKGLLRLDAVPLSGNAGPVVAIRSTVSLRYVSTKRFVKGSALIGSAAHVMPDGCSTDPGWRYYVFSIASIGRTTCLPLSIGGYGGGTMVADR